MSIATYAWFTQRLPGANKIVMTADDSSVTVDGYAYVPGYATDENGDPIEAAHSNHGDNPLLNASKQTEAGSATYTVTFSSAALSTDFSYAELYGDELFQYERSFPHLYLEFRYTKPTFDGFIQARVKNIAYAADVDGYTNLNGSLKFQYRAVTEQNTPAKKRINGFTAAYGDSAYISSDWTAITEETGDFDVYNDTTDMAGYSYGASYTVQNQLYVPGFPYMYDASNYYYSKSTFLEFRVDPLSWVRYFQNHDGASSRQYNFGVSFDVGLNFSNTPYYDSSYSNSPRLALSASTLAMKPSSTDRSIGVSAFNFWNRPTYAITYAKGNLLASAQVDANNVLVLASGPTSGTAALDVRAYNGSQSAEATLVVRISGPNLTLSANVVTVKMGGYATIMAETCNFDGEATIGAVSSEPSVASVSINGTLIAIVPVAIGESVLTVTATDGFSTKTATCAISVTKENKTLVSIAVTTPPDKTVYLKGEVLDTTGLVVTAAWNDGTHAFVSGSCGFTPTDLNVVGTQVITVSYGGCTSAFAVTVNDIALWGLAMGEPGCDSAKRGFSENRPAIFKNGEEATLDPCLYLLG